MSLKKTITVLNTPCILTNRQTLTEELSALSARHFVGLPLSVDFTNVHIVAMRTIDGGFYAKTSSVDWFVSDSQVLTWAISLMGEGEHARVYGPEFMDYFFRHGSNDVTHYLLGSSEESLRELENNLKKIQPGVKIIGSHNGYFGTTEEATIIGDINHCRPDLLWVGLGTPKQQEWIDRNKPHLFVKAILAVGFAFDVNANTKPDAPAWLGPLGLTWVYRLASEPRRLWKRYLIYNSIFLFRLVVQHVTGKPSNSPKEPPSLTLT